MHWSIPAKTFLVGEYAALAGQSAMLLTSSPCFELTQHDQPGLHGIHPASPAGRWWAQHAIPHLGLQWQDPYQGLGGMGASSAQFIGIYTACAQLREQDVEAEALLAAYQNITQPTQGIPPSGYDILAQLQQGCLYINRQNALSATYAWPFADLGIILIHTQQKLATHQHLATLNLSKSVDQLSDIVETTKQAFDTQSSKGLIESIHAYHQALQAQGWVAPHTLNLIQRLSEESQALAIKGCGAMGADVILLVVKQDQLAQEALQLSTAGWTVLTTGFVA